MTLDEVVFPVLGPLFVVLLALPCAALLARAILRGLDVIDAGHSLVGIRYAILVGSSVVPLAWFVSASLHQAPDARTVCLADHLPGAPCFEARWFALILILLTVVPGLVQLWRVRPRPARPAAAAIVRRVNRLLETTPGLVALRDRIRWIDDGLGNPMALATRGIVSPRVHLRASFAAQLDDEALVAALHHELEHVSARDPLRYLIVEWALSANPFGGWLLRPECERWRLARELHCDRAAVSSGASPTGLAIAIVKAARPDSGLLPALGAGSIEVLNLRTTLLLAYSEDPPDRPRRGPALRLVLGACIAVALLPQLGVGTGPLDDIHEFSERAATLGR